MKQKRCIILVMVLLFSSTSFGQKEGYSVNEQKELNLFFQFKDYMLKCINQKVDLIDSTHLDYLLQHFLFINLKADSLNQQQAHLNEIPSEKMDFLKKSVNRFYNYFVNNEKYKLIENLTAEPIRKTNDTFIFHKFNSFQKENVLVFFDKRHPHKTLGYLLFIPPTKNITSQTKIWSWKLGFEFGKFYFTSLIGEEGYEYMFDNE